MIVGIHEAQYGHINKFMDVYEKILKANKIDCVRLESSDHDFWEKIKQIDLFIYRWSTIDDMRQIALSIIPVIEKYMDIKCLPDLKTCWHYDDKIRQYYMLEQAGFPITKSWIFWDRKKALKWIEKAEFPLIFKLKGGAGSMNVAKVENKFQAKKIIEKMFGKGILAGKIPVSKTTNKIDFNLYKTIHRWIGNCFRLYRGEDIHSLWLKHKNYVFFQKFLENNFYDTRVTVIGNRAYAFRRLNRKNDFRSSGSGKIDTNPDSIDLRHLEVAFNVSKKMGFQTMAYDFLYNEDRQSEFCEISYTYVDQVPYQCPGYWDSGLNWHKGHFWPQYFQLIDALEMPNLIQPEIKRI